MREIKFRAWDKENNEMLFFKFDSVTRPTRGGYGDTPATDFWYDGKGKRNARIEFENTEEEVTGYNHDDFNASVEAELMQFTGLYDKNKQPIYEGDIIEFTDKWEWYRGVYAIPMMFADKEEKIKLREKYDAEPMHRFEVKIDMYEGVNLSKYDNAQGRYAVIGNVYQNPELLK